MEEKHWYVLRTSWPAAERDDWLAKILTEQEFQDQGHNPNTLSSCPWMVFIGDEPKFLQWQQAVRDYMEPYHAIPLLFPTKEEIAYDNRERQKRQEAANRMFELNPKGFNGGVAYGKDGGIWP